MAWIDSRRSGGAVVATDGAGCSDGSCSAGAVVDVGCYSCSDDAEVILLRLPETKVAAVAAVVGIDRDKLVVDSSMAAVVVDTVVARRSLVADADRHRDWICRRRRR